MCGIGIHSHKGFFKKLLQIYVYGADLCDLTGGGRAQWQVVIFTACLLLRHMPPRVTRETMLLPHCAGCRDKLNAHKT
jgi:hypothetical protein